MKVKRDLEAEAGGSISGWQGPGTSTGSDAASLASMWNLSRPSSSKREKLAAVLFQNRDVREMSEEEIYAQRIEAARNLSSLCGRHMPRPALRRRLAVREKALEEIPDEKENEDPDLYPVVCSGMQCLFCLGEQSLCVSSRTYAFARKGILQEHVEKHLRGRDWSKE
jgi:hypothetical protein